GGTHGRDVTAAETALLHRGEAGGLRVALRRQVGTGWERGQDRGGDGEGGDTPAGQQAGLRTGIGRTAGTRGWVGQDQWQWAQRYSWGQTWRWWCRPHHHRW